VRSSSSDKERSSRQASRFRQTLLGSSIPDLRHLGHNPLNEITPALTESLKNSLCGPNAAVVRSFGLEARLTHA